MKKIKGFSEFEIKKSAFKFHKESDARAIVAGCVGSFEEELESRSVTKKCEGVVAKSRTFGAGSGKLKVSLHIAWEVYIRIFGLVSEKLKEGIVGYGKESVHEEFAYTCEAIDEDGEKKLKAYPNCVLESGITRKIENGGDEVAEVELEINIMPDDEGFCMYEALLDEPTVAAIEGEWLENFSTELVKKAVG